MKHFEVNVVPTVFIVQKLGESMSQRGWGRIVIGSSIGVKFGGGTSSFCYSFTKHCSEFIPNIAKIWSKNNVLYNVLRIGVTNTSTMQKRGIDLKQRTHSYEWILCFKSGATKIRTRDTWIFSPLLYQLSYSTNYLGLQI